MKPSNSFIMHLYINSIMFDDELKESERLVLLVNFS